MRISKNYVSKVPNTETISNLHSDRTKLLDESYCPNNIVTDIQKKPMLHFFYKSKIFVRSGLDSFSTAIAPWRIN